MIVAVLMMAVLPSLPGPGIAITATIPPYLEARVLAQEAGVTTLLVRANTPWVIDAPRVGEKPAHWAGENVVQVAGANPTVTMATEDEWLHW